MDRIKPLITGTEIVAKSRLFAIEQVSLKFSNGNQAEYERLLGSKYGAVLIVPVLNDTLLLIREYAVGVERYELAFPKGKIESDESLENSANRELMEEVGYGARSIRHLKSLSVAPGYFSHTTHIMLAEDLYEKTLPGDEPEEIEVVPWKISELDQLITLPEFTEARSIAALYLIKHFMGV